jgi:hypothetical protein
MALAALNVHAVTNHIYLDLDHEFSGGVAPDSATKPWVAAELTTLGAGVQFTLMAPNLTDSEFVSGFYFNFSNTLLSSGSLTLSLQSQAGSFTMPTINVIMDEFKADGDGRYDILLSFATSGNADSRFTLGDSVGYIISYSGGPITAGDFAFLSKPSGSNGPFYGAAHIQNTGATDGDSGWISANPTELLTGPLAVPEPSATGIALMGILVSALVVLRKRTAPAASSDRKIQGQF